MSKKLIEVDLKQAESRFIAWAGPVPKLQEMYEDGIDIHKYVAATIYEKSESEISYQERQLGKKAGHAANYDTTAPTLAAACLKEMNLVVPLAQAQKILDGYHIAMQGGIRNWQQSVVDEVTQTKKLTTPFGRERIFYDRLGPDLYREAYAYVPQSTVPDIINHLMLHMFQTPRVTLLNQVHDSLLLEVDEGKELETIEKIKDQDSWNPTLDLKGGPLRIPIEIQIGKNWKELETVYDDG
jgi:DNA polymerase-1